MFGFSGEHILLVVIVLFVFGPTRLPVLGTAIGRAVRGFRESWKKNVLEPDYKQVGPVERLGPLNSKE
jgi:TatA/E family protein of Tat protein translocase